MKPIVKSLNLSSGTITQTTREDYISNVIPEDFDNHTDVIEPPFNPNGLKSLRYASIYHRKCLKAVAVDVTLSGHTVKVLKDNEDAVNKDKLEAIIQDYTFDSSWNKAVEDFRTYGWGVVELLFDNADNFIGFKHIRALTIRMCNGGEKAIQRVGSNYVYFKIAGKREDEALDARTGNFYNTDTPEVMEPSQKATTVIWIGDSSPDSDYYGEPEYISALLTILSDEYLREYNNNGFITNGIPNYFITITGNFDETEDEDGLTFEESMEDQLLDLSNKPGTAVVFTIPTTDPDGKIDVNVTKVSEEMKEASFEQFRASNMMEILAAHEVPPSRLGIVQDGPLGGSVDVERNKQYNNKVIRPLQRMIEQLINTHVVRGILEITDCEFEYQGLDIKDIKLELDIAKELFHMAAMKPIEIREHFKDMFNLVMDVDETPIIDYNPELGEFYINNQPLNMADLPEEAQSQIDGMMKSIDSGIKELITS